MNTRTARWYLLGEPCIFRALQRASVGEEPGLLLLELYSSAVADPRPMLSVVELEEAGPEPLALPVAPAAPVQDFGTDPDTFTVRYYLVAEPTLRGSLEAAAAGEAPMHLCTDLYAEGMGATSAVVRIVDVPVEAPAVVLQLEELLAR